MVKLEVKFKPTVNGVYRETTDRDFERLWMRSHREWGRRLSYAQKQEGEDVRRKWPQWRTSHERNSGRYYFTRVKARRIKHQKLIQTCKGAWQFAKAQKGASMCYAARWRREKPSTLLLISLISKCFQCFAWQWTKSTLVYLFTSLRIYNRG